MSSQAQISRPPRSVDAGENPREATPAPGPARSTPDHPDPDVRRVLEAHQPAVARLITALENGRPDGYATLRELYRFAGNAQVVGVTGAPGSGKSTLVSTLAKRLRRDGRTVAVVAVDPSSSVTGGAILGDRIRMQEHTLDPGIFVRSMSSRGVLGGMARATVDAVCVLDAAGFDYVIIETVGVGQAEIEIVSAAQTVLVVSVPGLGDDIQTIKAGLLEVADIHVVNKADRPDAERALAELRTMLTLGGPPEDRGWRVPLIATSSVDGTGIEELAERIDDHRQWLGESAGLAQREREAVAARLRMIAKDLLTQRLADPADGARFESLVEAVAARQLDPHTAARRLIASAAEDHEPTEAGR